MRLIADTERVKMPMTVNGQLKKVQIPPAVWLLDALSGHDRALDYPIFRIHSLQILESLAIKYSIKDGYRFSLRTLFEEVELANEYGAREKMSRFEYIRKEVDHALRLPKEQRTIHQEAILHLHGRIRVYQHLVMSHRSTNLKVNRLQRYNEIAPYIEDNTLRSIPTVHGEWENMVVAELTNSTDADSSKCWAAMHDMLAAWRADDYPVFNQSLERFTLASSAVIEKSRQYLDQKAEKIAAEKSASLENFSHLKGQAYQEQLETVLTRQYTNMSYLDKQRELWGDSLDKCHFERFYNHSDPFYASLVTYIISSIFAGLALLIRKRYAWKFAMTGLLVGFSVQTFALWARWYISGYPPVTDLYSSAIFISWGVALAAIILELIFKRYFALIGGLVVAAGCLIIAQNLLGGEDTLGMMRAVLDTKFWLATHVITITLGYCATFLAGMIAAFWCLGKAVKMIKKSSDKEYSRAIYSLICYGMLLSFVGTILGGLWADDSWGRFWGWDPKENGALLIVIWNAVILHALRGGMIAMRGLVATAIFGNIVTCFSWFGVNLLGVGLHSYGFTNSGFAWVVGFSIVNLILIVLCILPLPGWKQVEAIGFVKNDVE